MEQEQTVEEEVALHFKRFSDEKQDQVRALVNYATLMGLSGRDLVSIGGKLDRIAKKRLIDQNRSIVSNMGIRPIGKDSNCWDRWAYEQSGSLYHFDNPTYYSVRIKNVSSGKTVKGSYQYHEYDFGRHWSYRGNHYLPQIMLSVHSGILNLP